MEATVTSPSVHKEDMHERHLPRKVLHVVGAMNRGGVETWLMHIMRALDRNEFEFHFLVHDRRPAAYDSEILSLGGQIHYAANPGHFVRYASEFRNVIQEHGPFSILHSHVYWYSGYLMRLGYQAGIPIRIAHSHTATCAPVWKVQRRIYQALMRNLILRYSTHRIGISKKAGEALFGFPLKKPVITLYYGFDFQRFLGADGAQEIKQRFGIPAGRRVIGHVGRFDPVKNHAFLIDVFGRIVAGGTNAHLLLVGEGPEMTNIKQRIASRGLEGRCTLAGVQFNVVPFIYAMDVLALPSKLEGLGVVALEAQAAGVPVLASTGVPDEIDVISSLTEHLPLSSGVDGWASALTRRFQVPRCPTGDEPLRLQQSRFGLGTCLGNLSDIYRSNIN